MKAENNFLEQWERLLHAAGVSGSSQLARFLGISPQGVASAKAKKRIPLKWLRKIQQTKEIHQNWILTGESGAGINKRLDQEGIPAEKKPPPLQDENEKDSRIEVPARNYKISELVQKTIEVLESETICKTALTSNIEAFHEYVVAQKHIEQMQTEIDSQKAQLKKFESQQAQTNNLFEQLQGQMSAQMEQMQQTQDMIGDLREENKDLKRQIEEQCRPVRPRAANSD